MSEIVGRKITDLERATSEFGRMIKTEQEVSEFKEGIKEKLEGEITSNLTGLLRELQEKLPLNLSWEEENKVLSFSAYCLKYVLTSRGLLDRRQKPYRYVPIERLVHDYIHPNLKFYPKEHNPSIGGAKFLWQKITEIEKYLGIKLEGKYPQISEINIV